MGQSGSRRQTVSLSNQHKMLFVEVLNMCLGCCETVRLSRDCQVSHYVLLQPSSAVISHPFDAHVQISRAIMINEFPYSRKRFNAAAAVDKLFALLDKCRRV